MLSKLWRLNGKDFIKGLVVAVLVAVLAVIQNLLKEKGLDLTAVDWQSVGNVAVTAAVAYLGKNLITDENDKLGGRL